VPVDITQRYNLNRRDLYQPQQITLAVPAGSDQTDAWPLAVRTGRVNAGRGKSDAGRGRLQKLATIHE